MTFKYLPEIYPKWPEFNASKKLLPSDPNHAIHLVGKPYCAQVQVPQPQQPGAKTKVQPKTVISAWVIAKRGEKIGYLEFETLCAKQGLVLLAPLTAKLAAWDSVTSWEALRELSMDFMNLEHFENPHFSSMAAWDHPHLANSVYSFETFARAVVEAKVFKADITDAYLAKKLRDITSPGKQTPGKSKTHSDKGKTDPTPAQSRLQASKAARAASSSRSLASDSPEPGQSAGQHQASPLTPGAAPMNIADQLTVARPQSYSAAVAPRTVEPPQDLQVGMAPRIVGFPRTNSTTSSDSGTSTYLPTPTKENITCDFEEGVVFDPKTLGPSFVDLQEEYKVLVVHLKAAAERQDDARELQVQRQLVANMSTQLLLQSNAFANLNHRYKCASNAAEMRRAQESAAGIDSAALAASLARPLSNTLANTLDSKLTDASSNFASNIVEGVTTALLSSFSDGMATEVGKRLAQDSKEQSSSASRKMDLIIKTLQELPSLDDHAESMRGALSDTLDPRSIKNSMDEMGLSLSALQAEVAKVALESDSTVSTQVSALLAKVRQLSDDINTKVLPEAKGAKSIAHSTRQELINAGHIAMEKKSKPFGSTTAATVEDSPTTPKNQGINPSSGTNATLHQQFKAPARMDGLPRSVHSRLGASDRDTRDARDSRDTDTRDVKDSRDNNQSSENKENEGGPRARGRQGPHAMSDDESEPIHISDSPPPSPRTTSRSPPRKVLISDTNTLQVVTSHPPTYYDALTATEFPNVSHETVVTTTRATPAHVLPAAGRGQPNPSRPLPQASPRAGQRNQRLTQPHSPNFRPTFKNANANRRNHQYQLQLQLQHQALQQQQQQLQPQLQQQAQAQAQINYQAQLNQLQATQHQLQNTQSAIPLQSRVNHVNQHRGTNIVQQQQQLTQELQGLIQALNQGNQGHNMQAFLNQGQNQGGQGQGRGGQGQGQGQGQGNHGHTGGQGLQGAQGPQGQQGPQGGPQ